MADQMIYQLKESFDYSSKGEFEKTGEISIDPPSWNCFTQFNRLSQMVTRAVIENSRSFAPEQIEAIINAKDDSKPDEDDNLDAKSIRMIIFGSGIDFNAVVDEFKNILGVSGYVGEGIKFPVELFKELHIEDVTNMVCEYIANFISPSVS